MKAVRWLAAVLLLLLFQGAALSASAEPMLDQALKGESIGRGRFKSSLIGLDRGFIVRTVGRADGDDFVLDQMFRFDDGKTDRRVWHFRRTGPHSYLGTRRDVIGYAKVEVDADEIRMSYDVNVKRRDGSTMRLHFEDRVARTSPTTLQNSATIYTLGIPVGSVETTLVRR